MSRKFGMITLLLSILAILLALIAMVSARATVNKDSVETVVEEAAENNESKPAEEEAEDIQFVLYLGTNDRDTNEPVFPPEEAMEKAKEILIKHFGGYTIQEAYGGWIDDNKIYQEYTLVISLSDTDIETVHGACDELIKAFNQSSVLIHSNKTTTEFYGG